MGRKVNARLQSNSPYIRAVNEYVIRSSKFDTTNLPLLDLSSYKKPFEHLATIEITDQLDVF